MIREDIIRMARNVCDTADPILEDGSDLAVFRLDELDRFAALIAAAEREACIDICKKHAQEYGDFYQLAARGACMVLAQDIRARGK